MVSLMNKTASELAEFLADTAKKAVRDMEAIVEKLVVSYELELDPESTELSMSYPGDNDQLAAGIDYWAEVLVSTDPRENPSRWTMARRYYDATITAQEAWNAMARECIKSAEPGQ